MGGHMATKRTIKIKSDPIRSKCGDCIDYSHLTGNEGVCLYSPPVVFLDSDGQAYSLRAEVEKDCMACRQFMPIRSI